MTQIFCTSVRNLRLIFFSQRIFSFYKSSLLLQVFYLLSNKVQLRFSASAKIGNQSISLLNDSLHNKNRVHFKIILLFLRYLFIQRSSKIDYNKSMRISLVLFMIFANAYDLVFKMTDYLRF
jgi:hypothetical protein